MDLSPGTVTLPVNGPRGEAVFGVGEGCDMMRGFDSALALWQGAPHFAGHYLQYPIH
jgi:hypothetical protein